MGINGTATYQYWDYVDGDAMVCSPRGPTEYRVMCNFNQYGLGVVFMIEALWLLYNARRLGQLVSSVLPKTNNLSSQRAKISQKQQARNRAQILFFQRLAYVLGIECVCYSVVHLIGGHGTIYSTSTIPGLACDFFMSADMACTLYRSLLQLRGAEAFRKLVQFPTQSAAVTQKRIRFAYVLDVLQGVGAVPITFGLWVLLASGVMKRFEYFTALACLMASVGTRSMFENILNRVRTLVRVNELQQNAGGNIQDRRRRRNTLTKKARTLVYNMVGILLVQVFLPLSWAIFGSFHSSTQWLLHGGVGITVAAIVVMAICIATQQNVDRSYSRLTKVIQEQTNLHMTSSAIESKDGSSRHSKVGQSLYTVANVSGMSVVCDSEIEFGRRKQSRRSSFAGGLFSDIESDE